MASFTLNGKRFHAEGVDPQTPLLYVLRNDAALHGPRFGCGLGQCGACTVHRNGTAIRSCVMPMSAIAEDDHIVTLEGLGDAAHPHPLQEAFIAEQAAQCGYCTNGMIMTATALLAQTPKPTEQQVRDELERNLCRCGSHVRVIDAVLRAAAGG
jgi:nicotinate dehydrogenase subunit A